MQDEYNGELQPIIQGALCNLIAKTFKIIGKKKVFIPGKFANAYQQPCVKCALRANEGHLYPLEKCFVFIHKPSLLVRFDEVESVEFQRYNYSGKHGSTRNFDLCVELKNSLGDVGGLNKREYVFSGIDRSDYGGLYNFLSGKKIRIKNIQSDVAMGDSPDIVEDNMAGDESESEDEDFGSSDGDRSSSDEDTDEGTDEGTDDDDSLVTEDNDSELENIPKMPGIKGLKESKENIKSGNSSFDDVQNNNKSLKRRRSANSTNMNGRKSIKKKKEKDPNAPKRALSSFMFFSKEIRSVIREKNPDASFGEIGKLVGDAFKKLSNEEKQKFQIMADKDKERYKEEMANYCPPSSADNDQ